MENVDSIVSLSDPILHWAINFGPKLIGAILIFIIGYYLTNWIGKQVTKGLKSNGLDVSLQTFLGSMVSVALKILLLITVAGMLGIQTTSFVAVVGALGLAVGLALQGSLSNFAGGVLILIFKPFKVGDLIEAQGQTGVVKEIQIFNTILLTPDHKTVILANGAVSNGTIVNYTKQGSLRVDLVISVDPSSNLDMVKNTILDVCQKFDKVLQTPAPEITVLSTANGMVSFAVRPYSTVDNYWDVYFGITEQVKRAFDEKGIQAPIPTSIQYTR